MERREHFRALRWAALALVPILAAACGGESGPTTPTQTTFPLTVQVHDDAQRAVPGALVRVTDGSNAGRNATTDASGIATLSSLSAGSFTIEVTAAGYGQATQAVTMTAAATVSVQLKLTPNPPPVITALVAKGNLANEPINYSDAGEPLTVTATVSDAETTVDKLTFEWKADSGTFTGTGPSVKWQPANTGGSSGTSAIITVTVIEKYGPSNSLENKATANVKVVVHDSKKESGDLCTLFLTEFSNSTIKDPAYIVRNFSTSLCPDGKADELADVTDNRDKRTITYSKLGSPVVTLNFQGSCALGRSGDACVTMTCEWRDVVKATGVTGHVSGTCELTTIYERNNDAWKLCWSNFSGISLPSGRVIRSLRF